METTTSTLERERCAHGERDRAACILCTVERDTINAGTSRTAARDAAKLRAAIRRAERARDVARGYQLFPSLAAVERISKAAERAAARYAGVDSAEIAADTVETIARIIGRADTDTAYIDSVMTTAHGAALARKIARNAARTAAQGTGTMPRLRVDIDTVLAAVERAHRDRGQLSPLTVRTATGTRAMTTAERDLWKRETLRYQRVERSPLYSPWVDGLGEKPPEVDNGIPADSAPFARAPSRTVPPLAVRLQRIGTDTDTAALAWWIMEYVSTRRDLTTGNYPRRVPWSLLAAPLGVAPSTLLRRVRSALEALQSAERARGINYGDAAWNVPHAVEAVRTGNVPRTWDDSGRAVLAPFAPYAWKRETYINERGQSDTRVVLRAQYPRGDGAQPRRETFATASLERGLIALARDYVRGAAVERFPRGTIDRGTLGMRGKR